jgi:predicted TIM-barrel fold metal-dependent hydrolase
MDKPCPPPDPDPRTPLLAVPAGTCDCHFHIFGPAARFSYAARRSYTPPDASVEAYRRVMAALGLQRCVIVQPSVYGTDNTCTLDAMARLGAGCRGVAVIDETFGEAALNDMHQAGIRGVRFNVLYAGGVKMGAIRAVAERIAPLGWHIQFLLDGRGLAELADDFGRLAVPVVIDHLGHAPAEVGIGHRGNRALLALLGEGRCWVKLSAAYRLSRRAPGYEDVAPLARALIAAAPERVVWGSDWPHPAVSGAMPNDGDLLDLMGAWTDDATVRHKILVDNPAVLYGFS